MPTLGFPSPPRWARQAVQRAVGWTLRAEGVPRHIAFIMDGNRRYADRIRAKTLVGHERGYDTMLEALRWCLDLGVRAVSVYAFSLDNFKRSPEEVEGLMDLAEAKFIEMLEQRSVLIENDVRVVILGRLDLVPPRVARAAQRVALATRGHRRAVLQVCFAYTSSEEALAMLLAGRPLCEADRGDEDASGTGSDGASEGPAGRADAPDGRPPPTPPVDLLVRTSGEQRLSDFMTWQSRFALLFFTPTLWPDLSFWELVGAVAAWQKARPALLAERRAWEQRVADAARATAAGVADAAVSLTATGLESETSPSPARRGSAEEPASTAGRRPAPSPAPTSSPPLSSSASPPCRSPSPSPSPAQSDEEEPGGPTTARQRRGRRGGGATPRTPAAPAIVTS